jgi:hypothetical protein
MNDPIASLSLDLDNKWSYLKTHGDAGWEALPSYLDVVVPRFLSVFRMHGLTATVFVVGQDAALERNHEALRSISAAGHEIGNHSFHHEPWLHLYSEHQIEAELAETEAHLEALTGSRPVGFRGPGYSFSEPLLRALVRRGYAYDASTFPSILGPLARAYYFLTARLDDEQKRERQQLFGSWREGFRPLKPFRWEFPEGSLMEIPVTTLPLLKTPVHVSYLLYLAQFSRAAALAYFETAMALCLWTGVQPSLLLHPLDFLGGDDDGDLAFFPAMRMRGTDKVRFVHHVLERFVARFAVVPMYQHAQWAAEAMSPSTGVREAACV